MARRRKTGGAGLVLPTSIILAFSAWRNPDKVHYYMDLFQTILIWSFYVLIFLLICMIIIGIIKNRTTDDSLTTKAITIPNQCDASNSSYIGKSVKKPDNKTNLTLERLQNIDWKRFEILCQGYFQAIGYEAKLTKAGADGGIDIILKKESSDNYSQMIYVQCKARSNQNVGVRYLREFYGVMAADGISKGIFMSTTNFTEDAKHFTAGKKIKIVTGPMLLEVIHKLPQDKREVIITKALKGDYKTPTCPSCDIKMVLRSSKRGYNTDRQFWGCFNFPICRQKMFIISDSLKHTDRKYY